MVSSLWRVVDATDDAADAAMGWEAAASTTDEPKHLLIFNPYLGLSKLICIFVNW